MKSKYCSNCSAKELCQQINIDTTKLNNLKEELKDIISHGAINQKTGLYIQITESRIKNHQQQILQTMRRLE